MRKVERKLDDGKLHVISKMDVENDIGKGIGHVDVSYWAKLLDSAVSFSAFDGRCYGNLDKEISPTPISQVDEEKI